ncbi:MAG: glycoside hydrolase family 13 protein [Candidatus Hodarchaeales archaeon]
MIRKKLIKPIILFTALIIPLSFNISSVLGLESEVKNFQVYHAVTASNDNNIEWEYILHDTREALYKNPGWGTTEGWYQTGAVPVGQNVTLRIQTAVNDLTRARIRYWDGEAGQESFIEMTKGTMSGGSFDYWEGVIPSPSQPSDFYYSFFLTDGTDTDYYSDDEGMDGGMGKMYDNYNSGRDFGLVFYDPDFKTPDWHKNSVGYQIFIDRFYNGDPSNDPIGDGSSGDITWFEWDSDGDGNFTSDDEQRVYAIKREWTDLPNGGNDYFGGDIKGIVEKLDYLKGLGIGFIWSNPFSESPDNHGYSVDNYRSIDPYYGLIAYRDNGLVVNNATGSLQVFDEVEKTLQANGIRMIYDTVINHVSAQSIYFQRFEKMDNGDLFLPTEFQVPDLYPSILGAYESPYSPYAKWFNFFVKNHEYDAWWGFRNIPTLKYDQTPDIASEIISGSDSIFKFWYEHGVDGFRLDVNPDYDDGQGSRLVNKLIRDRVKADNPDAVIIGEVWDRANTWLTGTMNDGVQNMVFRKNTISWIRGTDMGYTDATYINKLRSFQDFYPPEAYHSLWTNLGNHDTTRIINELGGSSEKVLLAATIQVTVPGVPVIYYGDEVGLAGGSDPDCRRPFPWGSENLTMLEYYRKLISLRQTYDVFTKGSFQILDDNVGGILAFARELSDVPITSAVTIVNRNDFAISYRLNTSLLKQILSGDILVDYLNSNTTYIVDEDGIVTLNIEPYGKILLLKGLVEPTSSPVTTPISTAKKTSWDYLSSFIALLMYSVFILYFSRTLKKR